MCWKTVGWAPKQGRENRLAGAAGQIHIKFSEDFVPCKKGWLMIRRHELTACPGAQGAHTNCGHVAGAGLRLGDHRGCGSWAVHSTLAERALRAILAGGGAGIRVATSGAGCTHKTWPVPEVGSAFILKELGMGMSTHMDWTAKRAVATSVPPSEVLMLLHSANITCRSRQL